MAGINQGRPEVAVGEPVRFGDIDGFEIEQHPVSDRLIIRDTQNGKVAYVRKERGGSIGGDGVLIKALKEGKPMADDGRTYDTIQQAERVASSWVFVPPGTFTESVSVHTDGMTLLGSGNSTIINPSDSVGLNVEADNVCVKNIQVKGVRGETQALYLKGDYNIAENVYTNDAHRGIDVRGDYSIVTNCRVFDTTQWGFTVQNIDKGPIVNGCNIDTVENSGVFIYQTDNTIFANSVVRNSVSDNVSINSGDGKGNNNIVIGNRVISGGDGIVINGSDNIVANNRVSDSSGTDIADNGTGTLLDANLTGASN